MTGTTRAFTLVEILTAVAILALVLGAVFALYQTAIRSTQRAELYMQTVSTEAGLGRLLRDLACAAQPDNDAQCAFRIETEDATQAGAPAPAWRLTFCTTTPIENPAAPRWYGMETVAYHWSPEQPVLIRSSAPLVGNQPAPATNIVARQVEDLRIRFFDGESWQGSWTSSVLPSAAQLTWKDDGQKTVTAETFIAAGLVFTSKSSRVSF